MVRLKNDLRGCHLNREVNKTSRTLTGKIGNIHRLLFSSVTVKTFDITVQWAEIEFPISKSIFNPIQFTQ